MPARRRSAAAGWKTFCLPVVLLALLLAGCSAQEDPTGTAGPAPATPAVTTPAAGPTDLPPTATATAAPTATVTPVPPTPTPEPSQTPDPSFPDPAGYTWQTVIEGLERPIGLVSAGDGSGRLFILEQPGRIRILLDGELLAEPYLDISGQVDCCGERGLLGLAFHPNYEANGYLYVNYTDLNGDTSISRFSVSDGPDRADAGSELKLIGVDQPYPNHNGGGLAFGPDGYLYIGLGDGGSGGDPHMFAQSLDSLLGKILRIDVDSAGPYAIPSGNICGEGQPATLGTPAPQTDCLFPEIWAYGLRNPWRLSFDHTTGDLYIGDVGQGNWEEIDFLPAGQPGGANLGWNYREGMHGYSGEPPAGVELINPVAEYSHAEGNCSVTGGVVYRGQELPEWQGVYLFGDYCSGLIWGLIPGGEGWELQQLFAVDATITSFGEDEAGEIYLVDHGGVVYRLGK